MKRNKGFTLIELLAVIVILAIIALIATPTILGVIEKARSGAAKVSALNYIDAVEKYMVLAELDNTKVKLEAGQTYQVSETEYEEVALLDYFVEKVNAEETSIILNDIINIKGDKPTSGTVKIGSNNTVEEANLVVDNYDLECTNNECEVKGKTEVEEPEEEVVPVLYKEKILNGADPVISGDLIPVTIANDGTVSKADIYSTWYSYANKVWANAVILTENGKVEEDGTILESSIESYFVWIPRYRYELFAPTNYATVTNSKPTQSIAKTINIVFESKETSVSDGTNNWLTHPAFTAFNTNGIWVGKFETGFKGATSTSEAETNTNISDRSKVIIKPNAYSWRNIQVSNIFTTALAYNTTLNSHMMKNTEWGAVAYLSHSKYGINKEININNNSSYLTGYSAVEGTDQSDYLGTYGTSSNVTLAYNTETGYKASTTGNISGIYDMSGGVLEYMAAYRDTTLGSSGFTTETIGQYDTKYFDIYSSSSTITSYSNRILGDATGEMGPFYYYQDGDTNNRYHNSWYADNSNFVASSNPWFPRGGSYNSGVLAGQFYFNRNTGGTSSDIGFRLVLAH